MAIGRGFETTPLILDGVMYVSGTGNYAWAFDMRSGRQIWRYRRVLPTGTDLWRRQPRQSRDGGARRSAVHGHARRASHRARPEHRQVVWDVPVDDFKVGHAITAAPIVVKDKVIIGNAGGDLPTRGFLDAYDAATGKRVWRFYTIPGARRTGKRDVVGRRRACRAVAVRHG